jgi:xanthine dehydrogenase molybdenum-binding subunit
MTATSVVGRRQPKLDAPDKAVGRATYGHDVRLPGMLHGRILYSAHPHARVLHVDVTRAERLPGVHALVTAADNPPTRFGYGKDNTPLKGEVVRSLRDEVAAVAAVDPEVAEEAISLIRVDYEPLPAVFDAAAALEPGAPLVHADRGSNLVQAYRYRHGDLAVGEAESDFTVEAEFDLPYAAHGAIETTVVVAAFDGRGRLTLYSGTQIPFLLQRDLAEALHLDGSQIRILQTAVGGAFGRGLDIYPFEPIAALLARKSARPVRLAFSRPEEFRAAPVRQPAHVQVRAGARRDGRLTFRAVRALLDIGAYVSWGAVTPLVMLETTASLYRVPHVEFEADCVYTNNPITGAVRGYGNPQSTFFVESMMDRLAEAAGIDPVQFRLQNANLPGEETPQGLRITSCGLRECLEAVSAAVDRSPSPGGAAPSGGHLRRGIGFAATLNVGGGARIYRSDGCGATVKVDDFGRVSLLTGSTEIGQGSETALAQIVAEVLGASIDAVSVHNSDSDLKPWDVGVHASRTTFIAGKAAYLAALEARKQLYETASALLSAPPEELEARDGAIFARTSGASVDLGKVVRARHFREGGRIVVGEGWYDPPTQLVDKETYKGNISAAYGFGAQMAEVEVDTETGQVRVLRLVCANDVGRAINPMAVEGQIEGGAQMGLGYALTEELLVRDGEVLNPDFLDYRLFTAADMPEIETIIVETSDPEGPFGAKGVGEMGGTPTAAAIANAVFDAVGLRLTRLPMTPERVLAALDAQRSQGSV